MASDVPLPPRRPKEKKKSGKGSYIPGSNIPVEDVFGPKGVPDSVQPENRPKLPKGTQLPTYKKGGMVRGAGCAAKGHGRGKMY
jgi:hypothetical protein